MQHGGYTRTVFEVQLTEYQLLGHYQMTIFSDI